MQPDKMFHFIRPSRARESLDDLKFSVEQASSNLEEAMIKFSESSCLTEEELIERQKLCNLMRHRLRNFFPECELLPYGSTANGLGFKGCDLDLLFLPYPSYSNADDANKMSQIIKFWDVTKGVVPKDVLLHLDEVSLLHFVKQVFYRIREIKRVIFIPARYPILNFAFLTSNVVCDLSISNRLVYYNSRLINLLLKVDYRVKPLIMTLRYWAKKLKFIETVRFSSYGFTLLIIFFLQTIDPPILPSVRRIIEASGSSRIVAGWECSFVENVSLISPSQNEESLGLLLLNFFKFCWHFDFVRYGLSLKEGKSIPLEVMLPSNDSCLADFKVSSVCIQDPFVLSRNVASNVNSKFLHSFRHAVYKAYTILNEGANSLRFEEIFNIGSYSEHPDSACERESTTISLTFEIIKIFDLNSSFELQWFHRVSWAIYETLQYALLMETEVIDMSSAMPNSSQCLLQKAEKNLKQPNDLLDVSKQSSKDLDGSNFYSDLELIMCIQCIAFYRTWAGRKVAQKIWESKQNASDYPNVLEMEHALSKSIIENNPLLFGCEPFVYFTCNIYKYKLNQLHDIVIEFKPFVPSKELQGVFMFLKSFVPKTVLSFICSNKT